jgi:hypothetical protein
MLKLGTCSFHRGQGGQVELYKREFHVRALLLGLFYHCSTGALIPPAEVDVCWLVFCQSKD